MEFRQPALNLPRGRFTDALVAFTVVTALLQFAPMVAVAVFPHGFIPLTFMLGEWRDPLAWASPLLSQFLLRGLDVNGIIAALFNVVLLLIAGRYVEKSIGPVGLGLTFVAGAYGGAIARLALTPGSALLTTGSDAALYAVVGAYLMLYGMPRFVPIAERYSRPMQIAAVAAIWAALQFAFMLAGGEFELSVSLINPLGGLLAGALIARPLLRWRWRKA